MPSRLAAETAAFYSQVTVEWGRDNGEWGWDKRAGSMTQSQAVLDSPQQQMTLHFLSKDGRSKYLRTVFLL